MIKNTVETPFLKMIKALVDAKETPYTPKIDQNEVNKELLKENADAKLLFKKYYHNNFKKANIDDYDIGSNSYTTSNLKIKLLTHRISKDTYNVKGLKQIIKDIKNVESKYPNIENQVNTCSSVDNSPLKCYKEALTHLTIRIKTNRSDLKPLKQMHHNILLFNNHLATPTDIESDVNPSSRENGSLVELAKKDLSTIKNK